MMRLLALILALLCCGCTKQQAVQIQESTVEASGMANNALVTALQKIHDRARADRKAAMYEIARTAPTDDQGVQGTADIEQVDDEYRRAFDMFRRAEVLQAGLADLLKASRAAIDAGRVPDIDALMTLAAELQSLHASILTILSELR